MASLPDAALLWLSLRTCPLPLADLMRLCTAILPEATVGCGLSVRYKG